jgi:predicted secreted protein
MKIPAILLAALIALPGLPGATPTAMAAEAADKPKGALIDFRIDIQKSVTNDLGRATLFTEMTGSDPGDVARKVKAALAEGIVLAKTQPGIVVRSGASYSNPIYAKGGRSIESWRMRSELLLESRDATALSTVIGKLQNVLAVSNIGFLPAPETRRAAEESATLEAIEAFRAKAERIAGAMHKPYRIRQMSVNSNDYVAQPMPKAMLRSAMAAEAAPMPVEAGESNLMVNVSGQIELAE